MSVRSGLIIATCMRPASMCLEALNVAVEMAGWETASNVWVSTYPEYLGCDVVCTPDSFMLQYKLLRQNKRTKLYSRILDFFDCSDLVLPLSLFFSHIFLSIFLQIRMSVLQRTTTATPMQTASTHQDPIGVHARRASMETDFPALVRLLKFL